MPTDKIKRAITWIRKSLEVTNAATTQPGTVDGTIIPSIDTLGWDSAQTTEFANGSSAGAAAGLSVVPEGEAFLFFAASAHHTDAGGPHTLALQFVDAEGNLAWLTSTVVVAVNEQVALTRPILVPAGATLSAISLDALGPASLFITTAFVRLPAGEYLPGSPYG